MTFNVFNSATKYTVSAEGECSLLLAWRSSNAKSYYVSSLELLHTGKAVS